MDRRSFARGILVTSTGIFFIPGWAKLPGLPISAPEADEDFLRRLQVIVNQETLSQLSFEELRALAVFVNQPPGLQQPFSAQSRIDSTYLKGLVEHRYSPGFLPNTEMDKLAQDLGLAVFAAGVAVAGVITTSPLVVTAGAAVGLTTAYVYGQRYVQQYFWEKDTALVGAGSGIVVQQNSSWSGIPESIRSRVAFNVGDLRNNLQKPGVFPDMSAEAKNKLASFADNPASLSQAEKDALLLDLMTSIDKKVGALIELNNNREQSAQTKRENAAFAQNLFSLASVLVQNMAAPKEARILNAALAGGMQYMQLSVGLAAGAALGPMGWAAIGIAVITSFANSGGSSNAAVMKALEAIFKQLVEIRKSLFRIEERQVSILSTLYDVYYNLIELKKDVSALSDKISVLREQEKFYFQVSVIRQRDDKVGEKIAIPFTEIETLAKQYYRLTDPAQKGAFLLNSRQQVISNFDKIKSFSQEISKQVDFNGTGGGLFEAFTGIIPLKSTVFQLAADTDSQVRYNANLYYSIGIVTYIYRNYVDGSASMVRLPNPATYAVGIDSLLSAYSIFNQPAILPAEDRKIILQELIGSTEAVIKTLNKYVNKPALEGLVGYYKSIGYQALFNNANGIITKSRALAEMPLLEINSGNFAAEAKPVATANLKHFHLTTLGSGIKNKKNLYSPAAVLTGLTEPGNNRKFDVDKLHNRIFLRENKRLTEQARSIPAWYRQDQYFEQHSDANVFNLLQALNMATLANVGNPYTVKHHDNYIRSADAATGMVYSSTLKRLTFTRPSILAGISIMMAESEIIGSTFHEVIPIMRPNHSIKMLHRRKMLGKFKEYSLAPMPYIWKNNFTRTWKAQVLQQLEQKKRVEDFREMFPDFDELSFIDFAYQLLEGRIKEIKNDKIDQLTEHIAAKLVNTHPFDHIAPSLWITARLNKVAGSDHYVPFNIDYFDQVFRVDDFKDVLASIKNIRPTEEVLKLMEELKQREAKETASIQQDLNGFRFEDSIFYSRRTPTPSDPSPFVKADPDDWYDFMGIFMRYRLLQTATSVVDNAVVLDNQKHGEPFLVSSLVKLNGYVNSMLA